MVLAFAFIHVTVPIPILVPITFFTYLSVNLHTYPSHNLSIDSFHPFRR